jgi:hypothetical protein
MKWIPLFCVVFAISSALGQEHKAPLYLTVESTTSGTVYRLNSKNITTAPLDALAKAIRSRGPDWPIVVAVDDRLSINTLDNARGLIYKAGFANSEYYVFNRDNKQMAKITVGKSIPFPRSSQ